MKEYRQITIEAKGDLYLSIAKKFRKKVKYIKELEYSRYEIQIKKRYSKEFETLKVKIQENAEKRAGGGFDIYFPEIMKQVKNLPF
jgi:hypothetical protein